MTDGQAGEPPPGAPSRRALGAMESAVHRARQAQGGLPAAERFSADPGFERDGSHRRPERWLIASVVVVAVLVVVSAIALAVSLSRGPRLAAPGSSTVTTAAPNHHIGAREGGGGFGAAPVSTTTTSTTSPTVAGGPPMISSLNPSSGTAGQGIVVAGANFLSSNGQIEATFNGQVAPTSCPAQDSCTVTVPPSSGSTSAQVTITTANGTSNAITFTYS